MRDVNQPSRHTKKQIPFQYSSSSSTLHKIDIKNFSGWVVVHLVAVAARQEDGKT
ncbi:hypothetical protein ACNKHM_19075 [Shigella sonnei]